MTRTRVILIVLAVGAVAFGAGLFLGTRTETQAMLLSGNAGQVPPGVDLAPVWTVWNLLEDKYVPATTTKPLSAQDRVWGIIEGLAKSYGDPYTVFLPPKTSENFAEEISGSFGGVGVEIGMRDDMLTVIAPLKGTPGDNAGILAGDLILEVNGSSTANMSIDEAVDAIRGKVGTQVVFKIAREGEEEFLTIPVVRDTINVPTLDHELRSDGVYVISLYNFGGTAVHEMRQALRAFLESGSTMLVLDLRGNPGGYLDAAVDIASFFLPLGKTVVTEQYGDGVSPRIHRSSGNDITEPNWRIALLVDGGSASASEILAGALREQGKAKLIGTQTYGKGSVQELVEVTPDTTLKVTVARWLTPNGTSISERGLTPDLEVKMSADDVREERDPQLDAAVRYVRTGVLEAPAAQTASTTKEVEMP